VEEHVSVSPAGGPGRLVELLSRKIAGQPEALRHIAPYVQMYQAGLNPPDRPAGIFLLLGPTGTGKTRTVEAVAEILHGTARHLLKIDCAEYQADHEVAKLIGAPPGYIGHRETKPLLTQDRLLAVASPQCDLSVVLFDEVEKAAPSLVALLLGVLDRGSLRLGDNSTVAFEKTLVFLTSNLGARQMLKVVRPGIGFQGVERRSAAGIADRLQTVAADAVRRRFSPEFVNRIDVVVTYRPLDSDALRTILDYHITEMQEHVRTRLGERAFDVLVTPEARDLLLDRGTSEEYGARELKRTIHRLLTQPIAALVADGDVPPGGCITVDLSEDKASLSLRPGGPAPDAEPWPRPVGLVVDENAHLLRWLEHALGSAGVGAVIASSAQEAREVAARCRPDLAIVDAVLPDADGLSLALELLRTNPRLRVVVATGVALSGDEAALCEREGFTVLRKPFLPEDVIEWVRAGAKSSAAGG
jgi:ATP-dependent Clp protease ATP-binding subunit ClpA/CheY-like chemotaxis protein